MTTVNVVPTPNPDALMFRVGETLVPAGTYEYAAAAETPDDAPLAQALLALSGIELILIAPKFVTVRKQSEADWASLQPRVTAALDRFLDSGEMAVFETRPSGPPQRTEVEQQIVTLIDEEIRPAVAQDGGDITFVSFIDGVVTVRMSGACGSCPSSSLTLKAGVERLLTEEIPAVTSVEAL
ncbi:MAG: NifU family protein [Myxococcota bacterium]|nr:NifU family protein [Myxococcota bacterium]MEC8424732.1 NifU family protein [Myxococcota bacterium]